MFEKEAEEWFEKLKQAKVPYTNENVNKQLHKAFKDGAEFGYNKANEWHYVKDGYLPTHTRQVLVYLESDDVDIEFYRKGLGWKNHLNEQIKAWKEIVLPKESE